MNNQVNLLPKTDAAVTATLQRYTYLRYAALITMSFIVFLAVALFLLILLCPLGVEIVLFVAENT